jgi:SET and MYND domain-containing protein
MIHECWIDFILTDISKVDENQLVLYAQMANLVSLILPSLELDLKEIAHTFSKVNLHNVP